MQKIIPKIARALCRVFGHRWHVGFAMTYCRLCRTVKRDRLWMMSKDEKTRAINRAFVRALK